MWHIISLPISLSIFSLLFRSGGNSSDTENGFPILIETFGLTQRNQLFQISSNPTTPMGNILQADLIDKYVTPFFGFRSAKSEVASGKIPRISPLVRTSMAFLIVEGA